MRVAESGPNKIVDVRYVAPVGSGSLVRVVSLEKSRSGFFDEVRTECVIDVERRVVYADATFWMLPTESESMALPCDDPAGALGPRWRVSETVEGNVTCAVVTTRDSGDQNHANTRLYLAPPEASAYRG
jgi:hypothetical protein